MSRLLFAVSALILVAGAYLSWATMRTTVQKAKFADTKSEAQNAFVQENWPKAARDFEAMTRTKPKDAEATFKLAFSHHMMGQYEDALVGFWQALKLGYNESLCLYDVACAEARLNRKADAIEHLSQSVDKGFKNVSFIEKDGDLVSLHDEPGYKAIVARLKGSADSGSGSPDSIPKGSYLRSGPDTKKK